MTGRAFAAKCMVNLNVAPRRTRRQKNLQSQLSDHDFYSAVRLAVKTLFRFTHRASDAKALWSDAHVVWLGRSTFLTWCLEDPEFDLVWVVSKSRNAPRQKEVLREAVRAEVTDIFGKQLSELPRRKTGNWLPLP